ncbi:hypothetical protein [Aureimonas jatrophae]|uniref:Uncharacterized protein n=1 Tax=Aureimonas jatrophae TaxID=1166073 RepID=A0A1H0L5V0_9HYPH|nr:hypothetical protein [Aureimonas jatrophae]MBB3952414.1 hypothetical protein [Aureimonas jatrophae]SDO63341.1 hypothetical protein SAMN05192530_10946 [Aureimonas jatrophae]
MTADAGRQAGEPIAARRVAPPPRRTPEALQPASGLILGLMLSGVLWLVLLVLWLLI